MTQPTPLLPITIYGPLNKHDAVFLVRPFGNRLRMGAMAVRPGGKVKYKKKGSEKARKLVFITDSPFVEEKVRLGGTYKVKKSGYPKTSYYFVYGLPNIVYKMVVHDQGVSKVIFNWNSTSKLLSVFQEMKRGHRVFFLRKEHFDKTEYTGTIILTVYFEGQFFTELKIPAGEPYAYWSPPIAGRFVIGAAKKQRYMGSMEEDLGSEEGDLEVVPP